MAVTWLREIILAVSFGLLGDDVSINAYQPSAEKKCDKILFICAISDNNRNQEKREISNCGMHLSVLKLNVSENLACQSTLFGC